MEDETITGKILHQFSIWNFNSYGHCLRIKTMVQDHEIIALFMILWSYFSGSWKMVIPWSWFDKFGDLMVMISRFSWSTSWKPMIWWYICENSYDLTIHLYFDIDICCESTVLLSSTNKFNCSEICPSSLEIWTLLSPCWSWLIIQGFVYGFCWIPKEP